MLHKLDNLFGRAGAALQEIAWLLLRVLPSAMFMTHGYAKLFGDNPQPFREAGMTRVEIGDNLVFAMPWELNALFIAGAIELFGGLLLVLGLWTHMIAFLATVLMIMAYAVAHLAWFPTLNNGELAALYFVVYLALFAYGPGTLSVDNWLDLRRQEKRVRKMEEIERGAA